MTSARALAGSLAELEARAWRVPLSCVRADESTNYRLESTDQADGDNPTADQALRESIAAQGVLQPVGVVPLKDDDEHDFALVYGFRRFKAAKALGFSDIPAVLVEGSSATAEGRKLANLAENMVRANLSPAELMDALGRVKEAHPDLSGADLARAVGRHPNHVNNLLRLRRLLCPELLDAYRERGQAMSLRYLVQVCTMRPEEQAAAYNELVVGAKGGRPAGTTDEARGKVKTAAQKRVAKWLVEAKRANKRAPSAFLQGIVYALLCVQGREKFELPDD